jgi:hypothetical protein
MGLVSWDSSKNWRLFFPTAILSTLLLGYSWLDNVE